LQGKLMLVQFLLLTLGLTLLGRRSAGALAALTALADALPLLGTGAVLLPLAVLSLLEGKTALAALYWALCLSCALLRTVLEPRLLGHQGLISPFFTLFSLYLGLECFGVGGMIAAGVAASALGLAREGK
jgi:predicted PurR-regulated permease PerM